MAALTGSQWYPMWRNYGGSWHFASWTLARGNDLKTLGSWVMSCDIRMGRSESSFMWTDQLGWPLHPVLGQLSKAPLGQLAAPEWFALFYNPTPFFGWLYGARNEAQFLSGKLSSCAPYVGSQMFVITLPSGQRLL